MQNQFHNPEYLSARGCHFVPTLKDVTLAGQQDILILCSAEWLQELFCYTDMKRVLSLVAFLFFIVALIIGITTNEAVENEGELIKSFRDPDRVDQRWLYVVGFGTAAACFALWSMYEKRK